MEITVTQNAGRARLTIKGDIDEKGAENLKAEIARLNLNELLEVTLDLGEVPYIGSSGIGKILLLYKHLAARDGRLRLERVTPNVLELMRELKLDTLFAITAA
ncbi:MAG: STAS domain-containing protein [Thermodesulfobacteriota bacterium]